MNLLSEIAAKTAEALRALAGHLNHDQITGALETLAEDLEAAAALARELENVADAVIPNAAAAAPASGAAD